MTFSPSVSLQHTWYTQWSPLTHSTSVSLPSLLQGYRLNLSSWKSHTHTHTHTHFTYTHTCTINRWQTLAKHSFMPPQCIVFIFTYSLGECVFWGQRHQLLLPTWPGSSPPVGAGLWNCFKQVLHLSSVPFHSIPTYLRKKKLDVMTLCPSRVPCLSRWGGGGGGQNLLCVFLFLCACNEHEFHLHVFKMTHSPPWHLREWVYQLPRLRPVWPTRRNSLTLCSSFHSSSPPPPQKNPKHSFFSSWV